MPLKIELLPWRHICQTLLESVMALRTLELLLNEFTIMQVSESARGKTRQERALADLVSLLDGHPLD